MNSLSRLLAVRTQLAGLLAHNRQPALSVGGSFARTALVSVLFLALTEHLGLEAFGLFVTAFTVARLLSPALIVGAPWELQDRLRRGDSDSEAVTPPLARSCLASSLGVLAVPWITALVLPSVPSSVSLPIAIGSLIPQAVRSVVIPYLFFKGRAVAAASLEASRGAFQLCIVGAGIVFDQDLPAIATLFMVANLSWTVVALIVLAHARTLSVRSVREFRRFARQGSSVGLSQTARAASSSVDQVMLPRFQTGAALGEYALAAQFVAFGILAIGGLGEARQHSLYESAGDSVAAARSMSRWLSRIAAALGLVSLGGAALLSLWLNSVNTTVLGLVCLLVLALVMKARSYAYAYALTAQNEHRSRQRLELVALTVNVLANVPLMYYLGPVGAALATIASEAVMLIGSERLVLGGAWNRSHRAR